MTRPETVIPDSPQEPYPITSQSEVISGFGRGSAELGIPTANIELNLEILNELETGIYYGWCKILPQDKQLTYQKRTNSDTEIEINYGKNLSPQDLNQVFPMVMSIGWNPFYENKQKSIEIHVINKFLCDFYGATLKYNILGYIRPELNYTTKEALIEDINLDIEIAKKILAKDSYLQYNQL